MHMLFILIVHFLLILRSYGNVDFEESGKEKQPLLTEKVFYKDFLASFNYHNKYQVSLKRTNQTSLAYVTPWNSRGYDIAKEFAHKFSHISPVWLQLTPGANFRINGGHDVDKNWMSDVRRANPQVKFVPRIIFDGWTEKDYQRLLRNEYAISLCLNSILDTVQTHGFDGIVLEVWSQHSGTSHEDLIHFIKSLSETLHNAQKLLILVAPPSAYKGGYVGKFLKGHFDSLVENVDYFSLMTYDYSNPYTPGPNSPIPWIRECVLSLVPDNGDKEGVNSRRSKLMVGLNFYGYDFIPGQMSGRAILGHEFVNLVGKHHPKFHWNSEAAEHSIEYEDASNNLHQVYFPSLLSIARRLSLLDEIGTGISIWEIGQGLDSFYDQL